MTIEQFKMNLQETERKASMVLFCEKQYGLFCASCDTEVEKQLRGTGKLVWRKKSTTCSTAPQVAVEPGSIRSTQTLVSLTFGYLKIANTVCFCYFLKHPTLLPLKGELRRLEATWRLQWFLFSPSTHMCHPDACAEADVSTGLDSVQLGQNPSRVWSQRGQHFAIADKRCTYLYY